MNELNYFSLEHNDEKLVQLATSLIISKAKQGLHHVSCALRTNKGKEFTGLHISANIGKNSICAESVAIAVMLKDDPAPIDRIITVRHQFLSDDSVEIVTPCGQCRELILDHGPNAGVIIENKSQLVIVSISQLLPIPFHRRNKEIIKR